jgi:hypothetical protein
MNTNNWIMWNGGECPVPVGTLVNVKHRDGDIYYNQSAGVNLNIPDGYAHDWSITPDYPYNSDIVAYQVVEDIQSANNDHKEFFKKLDKQELLFETYIYAVMGKFQCDAQQAAKYISDYMKGE